MDNAFTQKAKGLRKSANKTIGDGDLTIAKERLVRYSKNDWKYANCLKSIQHQRNEVKPLDSEHLTVAKCKIPSKSSSHQTTFLNKSINQSINTESAYTKV